MQVEIERPPKFVAVKENNTEPPVSSFLFILLQTYTTFLFLCKVQQEVRSPSVLQKIDEMEICNILTNLLAADRSGWFAINNMPGIRNPMNFNIIKNKMLTKQQYKSAPEFAADVRLVFTNCYQYSDRNPEKVAKCRELSHLFELTYYENIQNEAQCSLKAAPIGKSADNDISTCEPTDNTQPNDSNADKSDNESNNGSDVNKKQIFACNSCNKSFSTKYSLMRHYRTAHESKKPFGCSLCDRQFSQKANMERHKNLVHAKKNEE